MSSNQKKLKVLIADDVQETRRNTRLMVSMIDNLEVVAIASNGAQAVQMAREHHPDLVMLDINMPELNGLAAYKKISEENPHIACIILSAEKDTETLRSAMSIGIQEYLIKPFTTDEFEEAVKRVTQRLDEIKNRVSHTAKLRERNEAYLKQLADEYIKSKRTDDQAIEVFEELASLPGCESRYLQTLAMIYVLRQKWSALKALAEKLE